MTPDQIRTARDWVRLSAGDVPVEIALELLREVDRLNAELIEARLTAEEAWCDQ